MKRGRTVLVATHEAVLWLDEAGGVLESGGELPGGRPTCLIADPATPGRFWCGTHEDGVFRSDDAGRSWTGAGLRSERLMALAASRAMPDRIWAGTEPSAVWRSDDAGTTWQATSRLEDLPSSSRWSFPPRPDTHHVRWLACHPTDPDRLWAAIEAGALIRTSDAGATWRDRSPGGPYDTHELAIHPHRPDSLRVAAGDGYFESDDGGSTWSSPAEGLDVRYLRSVAIDPGDPAVVLVSAATHAHAAYVAGRSDGRVYRRMGHGPWQRLTHGWPDPARTIAPLLAAGRLSGEFWAADERGIHYSLDGGLHWKTAAAFGERPHHLRGLAVR